MDRDFQTHLIDEIKYLREAVDDLRENIVTKSEFESKKSGIQTMQTTLFGWIIGAYACIISSIIAVVLMVKK